MTDLTEQWKKGELPSGWYFVKGSRAEGIYSYTAEYLNNTYRPGNSERIIEQVPSYEQWQAKLEENAQLKEYERIVASYYMKPIDYETACETVNKLLDEKKAFKEENTQLKTEYEKECRRADELEDSYWKAEKENKKLKEEVSIESYKVSEAYCFIEELKELLKEVNDYLPEFEMPMNILAKIDEALK